MGRVLHLVRHAMPVASPHEPTEQWPLSLAGVHAARALVLPAEAVTVASTELKAVETLREATGSDPALRDPRFGEVLRPGEPFSHEVRTWRRAWVAGKAHEVTSGWETQARAAARFEAGVRSLPGSGPVVIATHGMVMTAWLVHTGVVAPGEEAAAFWERLRLPDITRVELG